MKDIQPDSIKSRERGYLVGQILIAMPQLRDSFFARTLVYMCAHNEEGAMGIVLNKPLPSLTFGELLHQLNITSDHKDINGQRIHFGGPVDTSRGFVLHTPEYEREGTVAVDQMVSLTTTVEILRDISQKKGPEKAFVALGYAGWQAGQLDQEILANGWLNVDPDPALLFGTNLDKKWEEAMHKLGVNVEWLASEAGEA